MAHQLNLEDVIALRTRRPTEGRKLDLWDPTDEQWDRYGGRRPGEVVSLDAWPPAQRPPRARRNDPSSSHAAAERLERRGHAEAQMQVILAGVRVHGGLTSKQLAAVTTAPYAMSPDEWYHAIARRLPELREKGLVLRSDDDGMPGRVPGEAMVAKVKQLGLQALGVAQLALCVLAFRRGWEVGVVLLVLSLQMTYAVHYLGVALSQDVRTIGLLHGLSSNFTDHLQGHVNISAELRDAVAEITPVKPPQQGRVH